MIFFHSISVLPSLSAFSFHSCSKLEGFPGERHTLLLDGIRVSVAFTTLPLPSMITLSKTRVQNSHGRKGSGFAFRRSQYSDAVTVPCCRQEKTVVWLIVFLNP
ncbi:hypothetical protein E2C01_100388 [Portunus trituberculatus]|uniref:Secreted protein n=1 Tax=Portunus trituberculatus TaxID=210409 RepID=A0A5B7KJC3_PORTR|nr:hypothetical protein [Portunus trituberculatus]